MTRKDYELIATVFRAQKPHPASGMYLQWEATVVAMAHELKLDNPRFDSDRFFQACAK